jgi:hypothetical protein
MWSRKRWQPDCPVAFGHDPEKCEAVFRKDHAQLKDAARVPGTWRFLPLCKSEIVAELRNARFAGKLLSHQF